MKLKELKKRKIILGPQDCSPIQAFIKGNIITKLSAVFLGLGCFVHKQIGRGLLLLGLGCLYLYFMMQTGFHALTYMTTLGKVTTEQVFNETTMMWENMQGDNSMILLLNLTLTLFATLGFLLVIAFSVKNAYVAQVFKAEGRHNPTFLEDLASLKHQRVAGTFLAIPMLGVIMFTIIPIVYMIFIAFTNYDANHQPPGNLFTWVGLENFRNLFSWGGTLGNTFWPILGWTLIWAVTATASNYIIGMIIAIIINRKGTRLKKMWRFFFVLTIAVPQFVTLLTMSQVFASEMYGHANVILRNLGLVEPGQFIPFLTDPMMARITVILVNIWIGVPFTILIVTGILQNIPQELYEAAKMDGANPIKLYTKITLPYMLFITTPYLITQFTGNVNNFNVIFLLTGGGPMTLDFYQGGRTDLLITWLFRLSMTSRDFNIASVVGVIIFIIMATVSILTFRQTAAFKDEGGFQ